MTYKNILLSLENKSSDDLFEPLLSHFIKKNSLKSLEFLFEKTHFDFHDKKYIINGKLIDCFFYKSPTYKIFKFLYDKLENFGWFEEDNDDEYKIKNKGQLNKKIIFEKAIDYIFLYDKRHFLDDMVKDFGRDYILNIAFEKFLKKKQEYLFDFLLKKFPDSFTNYIDSKQDDNIYNHKKADVIYQVMQLTQNKYNSFLGTDKYDMLIAPYLEKESLAYLFHKLVKNNNHKLFNKFLSMQTCQDIMDETKFSHSDWAKIFGYYSSNFNISFKGCLLFIKKILPLNFENNIYTAQETHQDLKNLKNKMLRHLLQKAISHNKLNYLENIVSTFEIDNIFFSEDTFSTYVIEKISPEMENFLLPFVQEEWKKINLSQKMHYYDLNVKMIKFFTEDNETLVKAGQYLNSERKKQFMTDLLQRSLPINESSRKLKKI